MRYSVGILGAVVVVVLGAVLLSAWRNSYEVELKGARTEAQQLKTDLDKVRADLDKARVEGEANKTGYKFDIAKLEAELGRIPAGEDFPRPALESVPELDRQASRLGFQSIHAYRWRGGTLEGSFYFVTEAGPVKQDLKVTERIKAMCGGQNPPYDPRSVSGVVMIGIKKAKYTGAKDRSDWMYECVVNVDIDFRIYPVPKPMPKPNETITTMTGFGTGESLSGVIDGRRPGLTLPSIVGSGVFGTTARGELHGLKDGEMYAHDPERLYKVFELKVSTDSGK